MALKTNGKSDRERPRLGELSPQYDFFLNPYSDVRFTTSCPGCGGKIGQRKLPLAIHVNNWGAVIINKTCRCCASCELLIAHQDELEAHLVDLFNGQAPDVIGNDYLVVGTVERKAWRRGLTTSLTNIEFLRALHDFKDYVRFEPAPRWVYEKSCDQSTAAR